MIAPASTSLMTLRKSRRRSLSNTHESLSMLVESDRSHKNSHGRDVFTSINGAFNAITRDLHMIRNLCTRIPRTLLPAIVPSSEPIPHEHPIIRLPIELITVIFECFSNRWSAQHDVLAGVCRSWKAELSRMPSIYQEIHIGDSGADRDLHEAANTIKCVIYLKTDEDYAWQCALIDSVFEQAHRLLEVTIDFEGSVAALAGMTLKLRDATAPQLRKFQIRASERAETDESPHTDAPFESRLFSGGCPRLVEVSTSGNVAGLWPPVATVKYADLLARRPFLTRNAFAAVLRAMRSLTTLVLSPDMMMFCGGCTTNNPIHQITLPALLALSIWNSAHRLDQGGASYLVDFLESTNMPMLKRLRMVQCFCGPSQLFQFCGTTTRRYPLVEEVVIKRCGVKDEDLYISAIHQVFPSAEAVIFSSSDS
ncbi:hypothetical protein FIBSPDRAFT_966414 [Athelia psychrophila]|uniref:Uncharacterized protein n=1 Tax=Athelia psychrophila TaxID=1759441 RepID=A0A167WUK2_9AGAM|nr:hypothetical protein FIBSPDRAFT_966414 [Fibularhizoctonia sp. CBS 109695]